MESLTLPSFLFFLFLCLYWMTNATLTPSDNIALHTHHHNIYIYTMARVLLRQSRNVGRLIRYFATHRIPHVMRRRKTITTKTIWLTNNISKYQVSIVRNRSVSFMCAALSDHIFCMTLRQPKTYQSILCDACYCICLSSLILVTWTYVVWVIEHVHMSERTISQSLWTYWMFMYIEKSIQICTK